MVGPPLVLNELLCFALALTESVAVGSLLLWVIIENSVCLRY